MSTPEHLHLALNHLPFLGAGFALIPLAIALITNNKSAAIAGLLIATISGWATPFVMGTGEAAYERYEEGPIAQFLDPNAETYLEIHEERAHTWSKAMYASAVISTICLGLLTWKPNHIKALSATAAIFCLLSLTSGIWIAESGGPIRRPDFRENHKTLLPKDSPKDKDQHDEDRD